MNRFGSLVACLLALGCAHAGGEPRAAPAAAEPPAPGALETDPIRQVIRGHLDQVQSCYEAERAAKPELAGRLAMRFVVSPAGEVASVERVSESTVTDARLTECVAGHIRGWKFPPPKGGGSVTITYPFVLEPPVAKVGADEESRLESERREYESEFPRAVQGKSRGVQRCYQKAQKTTPDLAALLRVRFELGREGEVRKATLAPRSKPAKGALADCVLAEVRRWKFLRPPEGRALTLIYPFLFTAVGRTTIQDAVDLVVQAHRDEIQGCYEAARRRVPGLGGKLLVRFGVEADGRVTSVTPAPGSPISDGPVLECVVAGLRQVSFPFAPGKRFGVDYAFVLEPSGTEAPR